MTTHLLVEQDEALLNFLDDLLTEVPPEENPAEQVETEASPVPEAGLMEPCEASPLQQTTRSTKTVTAAESTSGRVPIVPPWGREPFQAMVFKVGELSLAIPLQELAGVVEWKPEQVEQQPAAMLCLGHYRHGGQTVTVVDTAHFIFPASQLAHLAGPDGRRQITRIILIDKGNIGLACDEVFEVIRIQPEQVTWRSHNTRRQWLAGTMLEQLIVVLDAPAAAGILAATLGMS